MVQSKMKGLTKKIIKKLRGENTEGHENWEENIPRSTIGVC